MASRGSWFARLGHRRLGRGGFAPCAFFSVRGESVRSRGAGVGGDRGVCAGARGLDDAGAPGGGG
jgi:hypothetical protein